MAGLREGLASARIQGTLLPSVYTVLGRQLPTLHLRLNHRNVWPCNMVELRVDVKCRVNDTLLERQLPTHTTEDASKFKHILQKTLLSATRSHGAPAYLQSPTPAFAAVTTLA